METNRTGTIRFRVLGPLQVSGDAQVGVTARRQRVVLALLLLGANQVVSIETLVRAIWHDPPATVRAQIQTAVSGLRRVLAAAGFGDRIRMTGLGYVIDVAAGELDLHHFDSLVTRGRALASSGRLDEAQEAFHGALGLWQGSPLSDIDSDTVRAKAVRLAERWLEVCEERIDVELELGRHHELIGEVQALVADHPLRERPAAQLMTALYRAGRQAEALATYQTVRRIFIDELGLEPSPALRQLERAILTGSPQLQPRAPAAPRRAAPGAAGGGIPAAVPRMLPARGETTPEFTAHHDVVAAICDELRRDDPHAPAAAAITGGVGVGKSTVAMTAARSLALDFPDGQLYATVPADQGSLTGTAVLETFLRALGHPGAAIPEQIEARAALYRSAVAERRLLVLVEDVSDPSLVRMLVPGTPKSRLIVTSRAQIRGLPGTRIFEIQPLDTRDGLDLLAAMIGRERVTAEPSEALEIVERCDGLPLALRVAAARLAARPHWNLAHLTARLADEQQRLDTLTYQEFDLRARFRAADRTLPPDARRLLAHLGHFADHSFATWWAAPLLDLDPDTAADVLDTLVDARLAEVVAGSGASARYRLPELVRMYAREQCRWLDAGGRVAADRRLHGAWLWLVNEATVRHGGYQLVDHGGVRPWPLAASFVDDLLADPLAWYEVERTALLAAVRRAARPETVAYCWRLAVTSAALAEAQCRMADWQESHETALAATRRSGDRLGEATILYSLGRLDLAERRDDRAAARLRVARDAFGQLGEAGWQERAERVLATLAGPRTFEPDGPPAAPPPDPPRAAGPAAALRRHQFDLAAVASPDQMRSAPC